MPVVEPKSKEGESEVEGEVKPKKKKRFVDSWQALVIFVVVILTVRFLILEPFKIPSGSMEPALIGHVDYGDRIATNKLAYKFGDPKRFDTIVFKYEEEWSSPNASGSKNYIKRLVGLPGDTLVISGGDLFLEDPGTRGHTIIRKWEDGSMELQESLWHPYARPTFQLKEFFDEMTATERLAATQENDRAFPFTVQPTAANVKVKNGVVSVQGDAELNFKYPVSNAYVKMGRWSFTHINCPEANRPALKGALGFSVRDPREKSQRIRPYLPNSWRGVSCPNCGQVRYPLSRDTSKEPRIVAAALSNATPLKVIVKSVSASGETLEVEVHIQEGCVVNGDLISIPGAIVRGVVSNLVRSDDASKNPVKEMFEGMTGIISIDVDGMKFGKVSDFVSADPRVQEWKVSLDAKTPFFYGGYDVVGDLKLEMEFELGAAKGAMEVVVGSSRNRAGWILSLGGSRPEPVVAEGRHEVAEVSPVSPGTRHKLSLAYVDGTVFANLNGENLEPMKIELSELPGASKIKSVVRVRFSGEAFVKIYRMDVFRDLYHTLYLDKSNPSKNESEHHKMFRDYNEEEGYYSFEIPSDPPCYMALGDNSPSSADSRVWGFVPQKNLIGRASFIWWPPSRWRMIKR